VIIERETDPVVLSINVIEILIHQERILHTYKSHHCEYAFENKTKHKTSLKQIRSKLYERDGNMLDCYHKHMFVSE